MSNLLAWRSLQSPSPWHWALGQAGEYKIFYENHAAAIYLPNGEKEVFRSTGEAKECAEEFERFFTTPIPVLPKFWMVYGINQGSPRYQHKTKSGAIEEARRLSESAPGITFVVLEAIDAFQSDTPKVQQVEIGAPQKVELSDDDVPF